MKRILLTGGSGFIGLNCLSQLIKNGYEVHVLDLTKPEIGHPIINHQNVHWFVGSINDKNLVNRAMKGCNSMVHLAAISSVPESVRNPERTMNVNLEGTKILYSSAEKHNVNNIVFASSAAVYGPPDKLPLTEDSRCSPESPYAISKLKAEEFLQARDKSEVSTTVLRFFNVYGATPFGHGRGVIPALFEEVIKHQKSTLYGDGHQTRDFVHVNDVVDAIILCLSSKMRGHQIFNICSNSRISMIKLQQQITSLLHQWDNELRPNLTFQPARDGDIVHSMGSFSKINHGLGWMPKTDFIESLNDYIQDS